MSWAYRIPTSNTFDFVWDSCEDCLGPCQSPSTHWLKTADTRPFLQQPLPHTDCLSIVNERDHTTPVFYSKWSVIEHTHTYKHYFPWGINYTYFRGMCSLHNWPCSCSASGVTLKQPTPKKERMSGTRHWTFLSVRPVLLTFPNVIIVILSIVTVGKK